MKSSTSSTFRFLENDVQRVQRGLRSLDLQVALDVTGSMFQSVDEAKKGIKGLFRSVSSMSPVRPDLAVGALGYRDYFPISLRPITYSVPLSTDIDRVERELAKFNASWWSGADHPEAVYSGLYHSLQAPWRPYSYRVVVLVGDAPPHGEAGSLLDFFPRGCPYGLNLDKMAETAQKNGVLACHCVCVGDCPHAQKSFRTIANRLGGLYVPLSEMDSLVNEIQKLMGTAVKDMSVDATVFASLARDRTATPQAIAGRLGKTELEVTASLSRLKTRITDL